MFRYLLTLLIALAIAGDGQAAELSAAQKTVVKTIADAVRDAGTNYQAGSYEESGKNLATAIDAIEAAMPNAGPEMYDAMAPAFARISKAQALLELEGVVGSPFSAPERPTAAPAKPVTTKPTVRPKPTAKSSEPAKAMPNGTPANPFAAAMEPISFVKTVAPILVEHCGRCHVAGSKGDFTMATFRLLAKGPPEGTVIFPGDVAGSRLIETIETGSMPKGGGKVPPAQLKTLKDWIAGGAKFDGPSLDAPLASFVSTQPTATARAAPEATVRRATGKETVSFAKDIAPVLLKNCNGCHIDAMQVRGGLRMDTFALLLRGGDSGAIVEGGKSATSLLVRKLKGEEGNRMPAGGRPALSDVTISLISKWIDEGAALDAVNAEQPLGVMASLAWAKSATDEQLNERRAKQAADNITLVTGQAPRSTGISSERFLVLGDLGEGTKNAVSDTATKVWSEIEPFVKPNAARGKITIFVMPKRYEYSEFAKMVEQRSIPSDWQSHWSYDGIDAYVAMVASNEDDDETLKAKLVGPLASLAIAMRAGGIPRWFAEGAGRAISAKLVGKSSAAVQGWNRDVMAATTTMKDGAQFIKNELSPEQSDLIGYGIVTAMLTKNQRRQYDALLRSLPTAKSFDDAFEKSFGATPTDFAAAFKQSLGNGAATR